MNAAQWEALYSTLHRLETRWLPSEQPDTSVYHAYDPLPLALFLPGVDAATEHAPGRRFLDIGCGIGTKLSFMHHLGWSVAGIERFSAYCDAARELIPEAQITQAGVLELDEFDADFVYMYRPALDDALEERLERHVAGRMNPGTILFLPARETSGPWGEPLAPGVWKV